MATITPLVGALTVTGALATNTPRTVSYGLPLTGSFAVFGTASPIQITITPAQGFLILAGLSPPIGLQDVIPAGVLSLAGAAPTFGTLNFPSAAALALAGGTPALFNGSVQFPMPGELDLVPAPSTTATTTTPPTAALGFAQFAPVAVQQVLRLPLAGTLSSVPAAPRLALGMVPEVYGMALFGAAPQMGFNTGRVPLAGALSIAAPVPAVTQQFMIKPNNAVLSLPGSLQQLGKSIAVATGVISFTGNTPPRITAPLAGVLNLSANAPVLLPGVSFVPLSGSFSMAGANSTLSTSVIPGTAVLVIADGVRGINQIVVPKTDLLGMNQYAPLMGQNKRTYGVMLSDR